MKYTLTILEDQLNKIKKAFQNKDGHERAGYLFCSLSETGSEKRFIVTDVEIVKDEDIVSSSPVNISVLSRSFVKAIAKADRENKSLIWLHSHPGGFAEFSAQDDREEKEFFRTAYIRAPKGLHGSIIVVGNEPMLRGRVWLNENETVPMSRIRVVGQRVHLHEHDHKKQNVKMLRLADRQVRAFGKEAQELLGELHIGIVGAGGTGSAVSEQLIRLGVKKITIIDDDVLEDTNVTRLFGSHLSQVGKAKVEIVKQLAADIGLGTDVKAIKGNICDEETAKTLRECDLIFCCTDDLNGRMILNRIAVWYSIPVIDMAIAIDSEEGVIKDITGRVTVLRPGSTCLRCRGRVSSEDLAAETLKKLNPTEYNQRVNEGYVPELGERDPSVIMFTAGIASRAVMTFMHMITGFLGSEWTATEIIERYQESDMGKNSREGLKGCFCMDKSKWGKADEAPFLGRMW